MTSDLHDETPVGGGGWKRRLLGLWWFTLVPAALTALCLRVLFPAAARTGDGPALRWLANLAHERLVMVAVGLYLLFSALLRYWRPVLPGGARLATPVRPGPRTGRPPIGLAVGVVLAAVTAIFLRTSIVGSYGVVSVSMLPTLLPGDLIGADKTAFGLRLPVSGTRLESRVPQRGDIIVFHAPGNEEGPPDLVKRVIGLPGDRITMVDAHPVINGWQVPSCDAGTFVYFTASRYTRGRLAVEFLDESAYLTVQEPGPPGFTAYVVQPGEVFVLGDNRGVSNDSRSWRQGRGAGVPLPAIQGRVNRILIGKHRSGRIDWARLWRSLDPELHLPGVEIAKLEEGVGRCLDSWPANTTPPQSSLSQTPRGGQRVLSVSLTPRRG